MKFNFTILLVIAFLSLKVKAQNHKVINQSSFAIEIDPIAYLLNGFSAHGVYQNKKIRFDFGFFGVKEPDFYSANKDFEIKNLGAGLKINHFLNNSETWFAGIGVGWARNNIKQKDSKEKKHQHSLSLGLHSGMKIHLFKTRLYISPWLSIDYHLLLNKVMFNNKEFKSKKISFFPTLHLGYKF